MTVMMNKGGAAGTGRQATTKPPEEPGSGIPRGPIRATEARSPLRVVSLTNVGGAGKTYMSLLAYEALVSAGMRPRTLELEGGDRKFELLLAGHGAKVDVQLRLPGQAEQRGDRAALLHALAPLLEALEQDTPLVADVGAGVTDSLVELMMEIGHAARVGNGRDLVFLVPARAGDIVQARSAQRTLRGLGLAYPESRLVAVLSAAPRNEQDAERAERLLLNEVSTLVDCVLRIPEEPSFLTTTVYGVALVPHGVIRRGLDLAHFARELGLSPTLVAADAVWHARWYDRALREMCEALGLPAPKPMSLPAAAVQAARAPRQPLRAGKA